MKPATLEQARAAKASATAVFRPLAALAGIGITRVGEGYALKVNLVGTPAAGGQLPTEINGVPVKVEIVGRVRARAAV